MSIALLYDEKTYDEVGIELAAKDMGIDILPINFLTNTFSLSRIHDVDVVIDRCQSKSRRERASLLFEKNGIKVINSNEIEQICNSKLHTMLCFLKSNINMPKTIFTPFNVEKMGNEFVYRREDLLNVIKGVEANFDYPFVVKPDRGSRGRNVIRVDNRQQFEDVAKKWERGLDNPAGMLIQECLTKNFDLRTVISKKYGERAQYVGCLARVVSKKENFITNTALGAIPIGLDLTKKIQNEFVKAAESVDSSKNPFVFGVDAIPSMDLSQVEQISNATAKLVDMHEEIRKVKRVFSNSVKLSEQEFLKTKNILDKKFSEFMERKEYLFLKEMIEDLLKNVEIKFIEINSRPDFYMNTRNVTGKDISFNYLECAKSSVQ